MTVKLPYRSESQVILPEVVRSHGNGKIPKELLLPCGIRNFTMVEPAARACRAMVAAALSDGIRLDATGTYRSYEQQVALFTQRYQPTPIAGRRTKTWDGVRYWQKPGVAMAATPGTSKHGLGVTPDLAQRSAGGLLEPVGAATLAWLADHGPTFGFWNSVKSEAWHWPYFPGDDVPNAVVEMERSGMIRLHPDVPSAPQRRESFYRELPRDGVLSKSSQGLGVEAVQWALTRAGFATGIDGTFGPATERSVREFQHAKGLTVDGRVDQRTWTELGLLPDDARPLENATPPGEKKPQKPTKKAPAKKVATPAATPQRGAIVAASAAYRAGFRGADLAVITMIAGRESGWQSDRVNPNTSDRGMWQINWNNLQQEGYDALRARLGIEKDADLLDLETNAAVAFQMYEDSLAFGKPWFPWRASDTGRDGSGPGWDPDGSHTWHTENFAAEAEAAAKAVLESGGAPATPDGGGSSPRGIYTIGPEDSDGMIAIVSRCTGITDAPWELRRSATHAVAEHNGVTLEAVWRPGDSVRFPAAIEGVRSYTLKPGDGLIAIARGLGLGRSAAAQKRVAEINGWQGSTPHPGDTWYGGAA